MARRMCCRCRGRGSWLSSSSLRIAWNASPGRAMTLSSIAWVTLKLEVSGSGSDSISRWNVDSVQLTKPSGAFFRTILRFFFGSSPALASSLAFSTTWSRLHHDVAVGVVTRAARPAGDLVELPGLEVAHAFPVELGQRGEHHGADRHVDADAEGVGAADDLQQTGLRQLLDQPSVLGQHARVVHADA